MSKIIFYLCLIIVLSGVSGFIVEKAYPEDTVSRIGGEALPQITADTAFLTKYIWRGQNLGDDPVIQSGVSLSKWGWTISAWDNYDTGDNDSITELDYTVGYAVSMKELVEKFNFEGIDVISPLTFSAGYTYYTFPNLDWDTKEFDSHEVYAGVSLDILLKPSFTWYWDVDQGRGSYYQLGISHTFSFDGGVTADIASTAGYNDEQWTTESGFSDLVVSGKVNVPVLRYFTVSPTVSYSMILDRGIYLDAQENEFYGGLKIGFLY